MSPNTSKNDSMYLMVGRIGAPYGVRGWVKVQSFTESVENLLDYDPWFFDSRESASRKKDSSASSKPTVWIEAPLLEAKIHGKGIVARFEGCDDRDAAVPMAGQEIFIRRDQLPKPEKDEYYWIDLEGLEVKTLENVLLGTVDHIEATGANDVLVVKGQRERLIPYVLDHIVHEVNIEAGFIRVDWDPDFD
jgi:16S rRNA processing protein RimM